MIRKKFLPFVLVLCGPAVNAQLYFSAGGGYGIGMARQSDYNTSSNGTSTTFESKPYSFGQGIQAGISTGYMFNPNIGAELGFSYLMGHSFETVNEYNSGFGINKTETIRSGNMLRIVPGLRVQFGQGKLTGYTRTGLVIGTATKIQVNSRGTSAFIIAFSTTEEEGEFTGGLSFGFHGAAGLRYSFGKLGIFCELAAYLQNWAAKKGRITSYKVNGVEEIDQLSVSEKEVEFRDEYTETGNSDPNQPSVSTKEYMPFSSLGLNIGIQFNLGGNE